MVIVGSFGVIVDQCWPLLAAVDVLFGVAHHCGSLLAQLVIVGHCWSLLAMVGHCWPLLVIVVFVGLSFAMMCRGGHCWSSLVPDCPCRSWLVLVGLHRSVLVIVGPRYPPGWSLLVIVGPC